MRLTFQDRLAIRQATLELFGEDAEVRLFGSRVDDKLRGGDIDLLVELRHIDPDKQRKSLTLVARLQRQLGDQPIDVLVIDPNTALQAIHHIACKTGIPL
ncbi:MAG: nucleotidyltransferase domain-containing protein [Zoogloea sp.]|nr:nucleotidyltransferase domain-containing protein [Zoogloea sp.]